MPSIFIEPAQTLFDKPIPVYVASTISTLAALLDTHSLAFSARSVLTNVARCLDLSISLHPSAKPFIEALHDGIKVALDELMELNVVDPSLVPGFLPGEQSAHKLLIRLAPDADEQIVETIGNLLITAYLTSLPMPVARCKRLNAVNSAARNEPTLNAIHRKDLQMLLLRSREDLDEILVQRLTTDDKATLRLNALVLTHLRSDLNSAHLEDQKCANLRRWLDSEAVIEAVSTLKSMAADGDANAVITLLAFCLNLHWDLVLELPLHGSEAQRGSLIWIDDKAGVAHISIVPLLRELGQPIEGCQDTSETYSLVLPQLIANQLHIAITLNPRARRIKDLIAIPNQRPSELDDYWTESQRARFIRSGAPNALRRLNCSRVTAAYGFLAFHLVTKPDLHYLTVAQEQISVMRSDFFELVGLGASTPLPRLDIGHIGSQRTALTETVRRVFEDLDTAVTRITIGRRYTPEKLIAHHNAYVCRVAMYLQFVSGGRNTKLNTFSAASWFSESPFGFLDDKDAGIAGGKTPVPIAPAARLQLQYWAAHLKSLQGRLTRSIGHRASAATARIERILDRQQTPLFFVLTDTGATREICTEDLFIGRAAKLNHDFGRHFMASALNSKGHQLCDVHSFLRHQGEALNHQSAHGIETPQSRLISSALGINAALTELGIQPLAGLAGGAK